MVFVFDLDDTLYPELDFVKSGFWAVAQRVAPDQPRAAFQSLWRIFRQHGAGRVFDHYAHESSQALDIAELVALYRFHPPLISLDVETRIFLQDCRAKFPTALVSDGPQRMQRNKFDALGLAAFIDFPVFTDELGVRKPHLRPFQVVMERFADRREFVYVADNPAKDFEAPQALGWRTVRITRPDAVYGRLPGAADYDYEVHSLLEIPEALWASGAVAVER
jgi:putative hydrolase of the HAD superfamily